MLYRTSEEFEGKLHRSSWPNFFLRSSRIRVDLISYESIPIDKREQYDWRAEKNLGGLGSMFCPCSQCNSNICQLRLDFLNFVVTGPSTSTVSNFIPISALPSTDRSRCLVDQFSVTSPGNPAPPVICGMNTNQHSMWTLWNLYLNPVSYTHLTLPTTPYV